MRLYTRTFSIAVLLSAAMGFTSAQESTNTPPEAPQPAANSKAFDPNAALGQQTLHGKFMEYTVPTFGPLALVSPAFTAGFHMASPPSDYPREWRQGAEAFGRNYADELARTTSKQTARFLVGALLREDLRYHPSKSKNAFARTGHAVLFTFFDKSDSGHTQLALANLTGAAAGGYVGNAYLPHGYNDVTHADIRGGEMLGGIAAGNLLHEFGPEIYRFCKRAHLPLARIPHREWWTPLTKQP